MCRDLNYHNQIVLLFNSQTYIDINQGILNAAHFTDPLKMHLRQICYKLTVTQNYN